MSELNAIRCPINRPAHSKTIGYLLILVIAEKIVVLKINASLGIS